jgi:hypothetical protein
MTDQSSGDDTSQKRKPHFRPGPWMGSKGPTKLAAAPRPVPQAPRPNDLVAAAGHLVAPDFFAQAHEMRAAIDAHFSNTIAHAPDTHQIWNYWHVPDMYTYLRTLPQKLIPAPLLSGFFDHLANWTRTNLNCVPTDAYLSLYVDGCRQELHNDALNGHYGYVFSLTRWRERRFSGGETIILKPGAVAQTMAGGNAMAGSSFYESIPAEFNQLLIFDDRLPHAVRQLNGVMDPLDGRIVLHGHLKRVE